MSQIISIHSFRGGTGKSHTTANLAVLLAAQGLRVGVVDTDIQSPGIHVLFGLDEAQVQYALNDYLWGRCTIEDAAYDVSSAMGTGHSNRIFLTPSSLKAGEIARILREGYDISRLNDGFQALINTLSLDALLIDTHPGLNEETLLSIAISDMLLIVLRPDQQDYLGTGVTVEVARRLEVPNMLMVANKVPDTFDLAQVEEQVRTSYNCPVGAVLPHAPEMMTLASRGVFVVHHPEHPITATLKTLAARLVA